MQTRFTLAQLADSQTAESERILRNCVHCGFCTATCPTYLLLGNELDSPRGRIYLIKDMLESGKPATTEVVTDIDRCLSCLSCMTTCPSGVNYMHLVDHARAHIEETYKRPLADRLLRRFYAAVLPHPTRFRLALRAARLAKPLRPIISAIPGLGKRLAASFDLLPAHEPHKPMEVRTQSLSRSAGQAKRRVVLMTGCAQQVLRPSINEAAKRVLTRSGVEVVVPRGEGCCGALVHHMGRDVDALAYAKNNIDAWMKEIDTGGLDAILITASGCGTTIKDYGFMLREDPAYAAKAEQVASLAKDITEYLALLDPQPAMRALSMPIAYHSACSMQHGQKITEAPKILLKQAGFMVKDVAEGHICCGSAGTYNLLQPEISSALRDRKVAHLKRTGAAVVATGNIGCMTQLATGLTIPIVHTIELLDWALGGPPPVGWEVPQGLIISPSAQSTKKTLLEDVLRA